MRAEDLHVAHFTTWWNKANPWIDAENPFWWDFPSKPIVVDSTHVIYPRNTECEEGMAYYEELLRNTN